MKRVAVKWFLLFILFLCARPDLLANPYRHAGTGLVFPEKLATLEKGEVTDYEREHPGLGVSIGYNAPGITVTVCLYTMGLKTVPNDIKSGVMKIHFEQVMGDVKRIEEYGIYARVKKTSEGEITIGDSKKVIKALQGGRFITVFHRSLSTGRKA